MYFPLFSFFSLFLYLLVYFSYYFPCGVTFPKPLFYCYFHLHFAFPSLFPVIIIFIPILRALPLHISLSHYMFLSYSFLQFPLNFLLILSFACQLSYFLSLRLNFISFSSLSFTFVFTFLFPLNSSSFLQSQFSFIRILTLEDVCKEIRLIILLCVSVASPLRLLSGGEDG